MSDELPEFDLPQWQPDLESAQTPVGDAPLVSTLPAPSGSRTLGVLSTASAAAMNTPEAVSEAAKDALTSLTEMAKTAGASGVFGVRLEIAQDSPPTVLAYGTAVTRST